MRFRTFVFVLTLLSLLALSVYSKGGIGPCLATCMLGDTRIGLAMNDGEEIEYYDWINLGGSLCSVAGVVVFPLASIYPLVRIYAAGTAGAERLGCCVGFFWGPRPGAMFQEYELRTKEILMCIPIVNFYPLIALPIEAYKGKTLSEVIEEEGLKR